MGIGRKRALENLEDLAVQVEIHLRKLAEQPNRLAANHWSVEVRAFLGRVERLIPQVGRKTGQLWDQRLEMWKRQIEETE